MNDLIEKVARAIDPHGYRLPAAQRKATEAIAVVLREVDKREDRDCVAQWLARENGIKLDE
jgi:hypothetical protein